jgi:hypothetical protein
MAEVNMANKKSPQESKHQNQDKNVAIIAATATIAAALIGAIALIRAAYIGAPPTVVVPTQTAEVPHTQTAEPPTETATEFTPTITISNPTVTITQPLSQTECQLTGTGSCIFMVNGISSEVFSDPELKIYVLLHSIKPLTPNWWLQTPPMAAQINPNGQWSVQVSYGSKSLTLEEENTTEVIAIVTDQVVDVLYVRNISELHPKAWSDVMTVKIIKVAN